MTKPVRVPPPGSQGPDMPLVVPEVPDEAAMVAEIDADRRHERFLIRAAIIAVLIVAVAISVRLIWG
ncbi:MAG: hypothetical protein ABWZ98_01460 [Nakamurella sp.]